MYNPYQNNAYPNNYGYGYQPQVTQQNGMQYPNTGGYYQQPSAPAAFPTAGYTGTAVDPSYQNYNNAYNQPNNAYNQPNNAYQPNQYPTGYQNYNAGYNQPNNVYDNNQSNYYGQNAINIDPNAYTWGGASVSNNNFPAPYQQPVNTYATPPVLPAGATTSYNANTAPTVNEQHLPNAPSHEPVRTPSGSALPSAGLGSTSKQTPPTTPTETPTSTVEHTKTPTSTPPTSAQPEIATPAPSTEQANSNPTPKTETPSSDKTPSPQEQTKPVSTLPRPLPKGKGAPKQAPTSSNSTEQNAPSKLQSLNEKLQQLQAAKAEKIQTETAKTSEKPSAGGSLPTLHLDTIERSRVMLNKSPSFATAKPRASTAAPHSPSVVRSESARLPMGAKSTNCLPNSERPAPKQISKDLEFPWSKAQGVYGSWTSTRKALVIACAYKGNRLGAELSHSLAYVTKVYNMLINVFHFDIGSITVFTDEDNSNPATIPTKNNIKQGMQWLLWQAKPGDSLFFYFFGHGGMQPLLNIEAEGILPSDYEIAGYFKGRELRQALVEPLPLGAKLSLVFDCFHYGISLPKTISGAPQEESVGKNKKDKKKVDKKLKKACKAPSTSELIARAAEAETGFVSLFGVTKPLGQQNLRPGYLTDAFSSSIASYKGVSYVDLLSKIAEHMTVLEAEVTPELSSNTEVEIHQPISL